MPTEKPRVTITISEQELEKINDYRFKNKMKNQTQAIISLIDKGFEIIENNNIKKQSPSLNLTEDEILLLEKYNMLNKEGQEILHNTATGLVATDQYKKYNQHEVVEEKQA